VTPTVTDIIIRATHTQEVLGEQGRRIREVWRTPFNSMRRNCWSNNLRSLPA
jgi:ribosomal protein S3